MREIKFRVWDKNECKMKVVKEMNFKEANLINELFPLMQYTNCYDINGKEIFEGDLVETTRALNHIVGVVTMIKGCWYIQDGKDSYYRLIPRFGKAENKVIGNVFENKKLLEGRYE